MSTPDRLFFFIAFVCLAIGATTEFNASHHATGFATLFAALVALIGCRP